MSLKQLEDMVAASLFHEKLPTAGSMRSQIALLRALPVFTSVTDDEAELLARGLEARLDIGMAIGSSEVFPPRSSPRQSREGKTRQSRKRKAWQSREGKTRQKVVMTAPHRL